MAYHFCYGVRITNEDTGEIVHFHTEEWFKEDKEYFEKYRNEVVESEKRRSEQPVIYIPSIQKRVKVRDVNFNSDNISCILCYKTDDKIRVNGRESNHSFIIEEHYYAKE